MDGRRSSRCRYSCTCTSPYGLCMFPRRAGLGRCSRNGRTYRLLSTRLPRCVDALRAAQLIGWNRRAVLAYLTLFRSLHRLFDIRDTHLHDEYARRAVFDQVGWHGSDRSVRIIAVAIFVEPAADDDADAVFPEVDVLAHGADRVDFEIDAVLAGAFFGDREAVRFVEVAVIPAGWAAAWPDGFQNRPRHAVPSCGDQRIR